MNNDLLIKAKRHKVTHTFSGKHHFFKVLSVTGESYDVAIQARCTCDYMGIQGVANAEVCSHILAVMNAIVQEGGIPKGK